MACLIDVMGMNLLFLQRQFLDVAVKSRPAGDPPLFVARFGWRYVKNDDVIATDIETLFPDRINSDKIIYLSDYRPNWIGVLFQLTLALKGDSGRRIYVLLMLFCLTAINICY